VFESDSGVNILYSKMCKEKIELARKCADWCKIDDSK
jgi:hypothetical protein